MFSRKLLFSTLIFANFCAFADNNKIQLKTEEEKVSYTIGAGIGQDLKRQEFKVKATHIIEGIKDGLQGKVKLTNEEMEKLMSEFQKKQMAEFEKKQEKIASENLAKSDAFLEKNKSKSGIKSTNSGLQYQIINEGKGNKPSISDTVTVNYKGMLIDGTEFDSSYKRNQPATFPLSDVIEGWQEGLQLIAPGGKLKLFVPPQLAYGKKGIGNIIQPNSLLVFEVELLKIENSDSAKN